MSLRPWFLFSASIGLFGCSWSRFDDLEDDTPVVLLEKPSKLHGFGVSISVARSEEAKSTRALIGQAPGKRPAATFTLGSATDPATGASDTGSCNQDFPCYLSGSTAGLGLADVGGEDPDKLCFVFGIGKSDGAKDYGLMGRCVSSVEYTLPVPNSKQNDVQKKLIEDEIIFQDAMAPLALASDKDEAAALIAGASGDKQRLAWFYPPLRNQPVDLVPPGDRDESFGAAVAVVRLGTGDQQRRVYAVGAPAAGHVWLFDDAGKPVGCLGGPSEFGRTLASGHVDSDDMDELVVADTTNVTVISGAALSPLAPAADITCSLASLPPDALIASFSCGSRETLAGCPGGFGAAIDVGDLDGDGDGEVVVGAPEMKVRGTSRAGAVLVYDAEGKRSQLLSDQLFLSSAEGGDRLGRALAVAPINGRDVVVAGAPGNARTAIFYCSSLLSGGGSRCE